jgi:hypothetical protein
MEFGAQAGMAILPQRAAAANDRVVFEGPVSAHCGPTLLAQKTTL